MSRQKSIEKLHVPYDELKININSSTTNFNSQQQLPNQNTQMSLVSSIMTETPDKEPLSSVTGTEHRTSTYFIAGAAAGVMEHCVMYPVDSIKVL